MIHTTQLLLDKANSYEKAGQWQSAVDLCESLFESSWRAGQIDDALEVLLKLALLYNSRSEREVAAEYYELVSVVAAAHSNKQVGARALNGLGIISHRSGNLDEADRYYAVARKFAGEAGDSKTAGDIQVNLGIVANIRGELRASLRHYRRALTEYESAGEQERIARVLNNLGMLYIDLEDFPHAETSLDRALHICRLIGEVQVEGIVLTNKAELLLLQGKTEEARPFCDDAFEKASRLGRESLKAEVLKLYGILFSQLGKPNLAESHLQQAIDLSGRLQHPLLQAEALREKALLLRSCNRNKEAFDALNQAHQIFSSIKAGHDQADVRKRLSQLESDFLVLVEMWGESIEAKDRYTRGHCQRVAEYACELATAAGIPEEELVWFRMGAFLHDVGKTEVPEEILNKPGKLTDEERTVIENHTIAGDDLLSSTDFPYDIRPMVRWHHERWDGRGYPDRLSGEQIPFTARILHIVDVFDALTTARSYREPLSTQKAIEIMQEDEGSFDPELFALFLKRIRRKRVGFRSARGR